MIPSQLKRCAISRNRDKVFAKFEGCYKYKTVNVVFVFMIPWMSVLLLLLPGCCGQCPAIGDQCRCTYVEGQLQLLTCSNLGHLTQFPPLSPSDDVIQELVLYQSTISSIQSNAFNKIKVRRLSLDNLEIRDLDPKAFSGVGDYLEGLVLSNNQLDDLSAGIFSNLSNLMLLKLNGNLLTSLQEDYFIGLHRLKYLHLQSNDIVSFEKNTFHDLSSLVQLQLYDNKLTTIQAGVFGGLGDLLELNIRENNISVLDELAFQNLTKLQRLYMSFNSISELQNRLLRDVVDLRLFDIAVNNVASIPSGLFYTTLLIRHVDLSYNNISHYHPSIFETSRKLCYLYMQNNMLDIIHPFSFENCANLEVLYLQNNVIKNLPDQSLNGMTMLKTLDLHNNQIRHLGYGIFDQVGNTQYLDISHNRISSVEPGPFNAVRGLQQLNVTSNRLRTLTPDWFRNLHNLTELLLGKNRINLIEEGTFKRDAMKQVTILDLDSNRLSVIPNGTFENFTSLEILRLSRNPVLSLYRETFEGLRSLSKLYVNNTCLSDLPNALCSGMPSLLELYLQNNAIENISSEAFVNCNALSHLDMSQNELMHIDSKAFSPCVSLSMVNLSYNSLTEEVIPFITSPCPMLNVLDVSVNHFSTLSQDDILKPQIKLQELYLSYNPLICDCNTIWLRNYQPFVDYKTSSCKSMDKPHPHSVSCYPIPGTCGRNFPVLDHVTVTCNANPFTKADDNYQHNLPPLFDHYVCDEDYYFTTNEVIFQTTSGIDFNISATLTEDNMVTPTTPPYPSLVSFDITMRTTSVVIKWKMNSIYYITAYRITYKKKKKSTSNATENEIFIDNPRVSKKVIYDLQENTTYLVCIGIYHSLSAVPEGIPRTCKVVNTLLPPAPASGINVLHIAVIAAAAGVVAIFIAVFVAVYFLYCKKKEDRQKANKHKEIEAWVESVRPPQPVSRKESFSSVDPNEEMVEQSTLTVSLVSLENAGKNSSRVSLDKVGSKVSLDKNGIDASRVSLDTTGKDASRVSLDKIGNDIHGSTNSLKNKSSKKKKDNAKFIGNNKPNVIPE